MLKDKYLVWDCKVKKMIENEIWEDQMFIFHFTLNKLVGTIFLSYLSILEAGTLGVSGTKNRGAFRSSLSSGLFFSVFF